MSGSDTTVRICIDPSHDGEQGVAILAGSQLAVGELAALDVDDVLASVEARGGSRRARRDLKTLAERGAATLRGPASAHTMEILLESVRHGPLIGVRGFGHVEMVIEVPAPPARQETRVQVMRLMREVGRWVCAAELNGVSPIVEWLPHVWRSKFCQWWNAAYPRTPVRAMPVGRWKWKRFAQKKATTHFAPAFLAYPLTDHEAEALCLGLAAWWDERVQAEQLELASVGGSIVDQLPRGASSHIPIRDPTQPPGGGKADGLRK